MRDGKIIVIVLLLGLQLVAIAVNIALTKAIPHCEPAKPQLSCAAIPRSYIGDYPECADRLLKAMNITNIEIRRYNGSLPGDEICQDPIIQAWQKAQPNRTICGNVSTPMITNGSSPDGVTTNHTSM